MTDQTWKDPEAYVHLQQSSLAGLAWEFLRRNADYRISRRPTGGGEAARAASDWGLCVLPDPDFGGDVQPIFWRPECDPRMLLIGASRAAGPAAVCFDPDVWSSRLAVIWTDVGLCYRLRIGAEEHRFFAAEPLSSGQAITVVEPLDGWMGVRAEAARRLFRRLRHPDSPPQSQPNPPVVRRAIVLLRALDGRRASASRRAIAEALLGFRPAGPKAWEECAERKRVGRLLSGAAAVSKGGYRAFLSRAIDV